MSPTLMVKSVCPIRVCPFKKGTGNVMVVVVVVVVVAVVVVA